MLKIAFVGDIMLGRLVGEKFSKKNYQIVDSKIKKRIQNCDFSIANLESPITEGDVNYDSLSSLQFIGKSDILEQFKWIHLFSLSNNHINDAGEKGMDDTINSLNKAEIAWNGLFKKRYEPFLLEKNNERVAIITCTDLINKEFDTENKWKTLRIDTEELDLIIKECKHQGYFIILYAHVGMLFSRFPSQSVREILQKKIDLGVDMVITVHPHVLGGMEFYKGHPIIYSLGDFVMDGASYRRRKSAFVEICIDNGVDVTNYNTSIFNCVINDDLITEYAEGRVNEKMSKSWKYVTNKIADKDCCYLKFYRHQYKIEMLQHSLSTLNYQIQTRGFCGMFKILFYRSDSVFKMLGRLVFGRANNRYDSDAVPKDGKDLFVKDIK